MFLHKIRDLFFFFIVLYFNILRDQFQNPFLPCVHCNKNSCIFIDLFFKKRLHELLLIKLYFYRAANDRIFEGLPLLTDTSDFNVTIHLVRIYISCYDHTILNYQKLSSHYGDRNIIARALSKLTYT